MSETETQPNHSNRKAGNICLRKHHFGQKRGEQMSQTRREFDECKDQSHWKMSSDTGYVQQWKDSGEFSVYLNCCCAPTWVVSADALLQAPGQTTTRCLVVDLLCVLMLLHQKTHHTGKVTVLKTDFNHESES